MVTEGGLSVAPLATLACSGQPGAIKPGLERSVYVTGAAVAAIADRLVKDVSTRAVLGGLLAGVTFDLTHVCGDGDPGEPSMTAEDWLDAIDYARPGVNIPAGAKVLQWFTHLMWPVWCDCSNGTSPPENTVTPPPVSDSNPNTAPGPVGGGCWTSSQTRLPNYSSLLAWNFNDTLPQIAPFWNNGGLDIPTIQTPAPASLVVTMSAGTEGASPGTASGQVNFYNASHQPAGVGNVGGAAPGASITSNPIVIPATAVSWQGIATSISQPGGTATNRVTWTSTIYCQGESPTNVITPCCPPDPSLDIRLRGIMDMLTQLLSLQSLAGPYVPSVSHTGLSGQGTISINPASSAVRFDVTSDLSSWPHNPQTPNYYYSLGFVTPFAVGTPLRGQRLIYNHQIFTWPSYTDTIGYTFPPGITANLVELTQGAT